MVESSLMGIVSPGKMGGVIKILLPLLLIILSPILILALLIYLLWGACLYLGIWLTWKKPRLLFVYSNSPTWQDYIEGEILPFLQDRAVILNWSDRKHWKNSLAVLSFQYFGGYRNFNPMALVFRPFHFAKAYRFFEPFKEFKHGAPEKVESLKRELFDDLAI